MAVDVSKELAEILEEYHGELDDAIETVFSDVARETKAMLKSTSPRSNSGGKHYANGWTVDINKRAKTTTVYNKTKPGLTHLLENGHAVKNQFGTWGRVDGRPHIKPAEEWANAQIERRITEVLDK